MKPLLAAAFYSGLCPLGEPPSYKPGWRNVTYGVLVNLTLLALIVGFLASELFFAYVVASAMEDAMADADVDLNLYLNLLGAEGVTAEPNGTVSPTLAVESEFAQSQLTRVMKVSSGVAMTVATLGLVVGYVRKLKHLPAVFRMGDELPGKPQWKTVLFVAELSVYTIPMSTWAVKTYFESRGLTHVDAYGVIGMLVTVEKFMILHLVARVGLGFDVVNRRLGAVGEPRPVAEVPGYKARPFGPESPVCATLIELRRLHLGLCDMLETIVRAYEVQLLTFLVSEFATTVLTLYIEARNVYLNTVQFMDLIAIIFLLLITQVTTLLYGTCRSTSCKGNATAAIVHKIINTRRFNEEEIQQLMIFSMQISHREISVSPYDMVTIDYSLLQAMLASVAMHIVILVQFNLSSTT